jgi:hypothetical protein
MKIVLWVVRLCMAVLVSHNTIGCDTPLWWLKNACPACTYWLEGETGLKFSMLVTMDGNDLLKHVLCKNAEDGGDGNPITTVIETPNSHIVHGDYYLSRESVNQWAWQSDPSGSEDLRLSTTAEDNPCASCWKNMIMDKTSCMWSVFDKTSIFLSLCHHGYPLVVADMVQSGEQYVFFLNFCCGAFSNHSLT